MSQNDNIEPQEDQNLDDYIKQLEEKEKSSRSKKFKMTILALALAGAGAAAGGYFMTQNNGTELDDSMATATAVNAVSTSFVEVDAKDASLDYALLKLSESNVALIVNNEGVKDTFMTAQQALDRSDFFTGTAEIVVDGEEEAAEARDYSNVKFAISGNKETNKRLLFNVANGENEEYLLSFGDGSVYRVKESTGYAFKKPGSYTVKLMKRVAGKMETLDEKSITITGDDPDLANVSTTNSSTTPIDPSEGTPTTASATTSTSLPAATTVAQPTEAPVSELSTKGTETKAEDKGAVAKQETKAGEDEEEVKLVESFEPEEKAPAAAPEKDYSKPFIYALVQKKPSFPGGESKLYSFVSRKIKYPRRAKQKDVQGKVFVQFMIGTDGSIQNEKVLKGIGYGCDEEALKVIRAMPKWIPGEQDGQKVNVLYTVPITFKLR